MQKKSLPFTYTYIDNCATRKDTTRITNAGTIIVLVSLTFDTPSSFSWLNGFTTIFVADIWDFLKQYFNIWRLTKNWLFKPLNIWKILCLQQNVDVGLTAFFGLKWLIKASWKSVHCLWPPPLAYCFSGLTGTSHTDLHLIDTSFADC